MSRRRRIHTKRTGAPSFCFTSLLTPTARLAIPRAFLARLPRRGVHFPRIVALGFAAAIGTNDRVRVHTHELVEFLTAIFAFVL